MADEPWLKFQTETPANVEKPWEKFGAAATASAPTAGSWEKFAAPDSGFSPPQPAQPGIFKRGAQAIVGGLGKIGEHLGIPSDEIKNKAGETVFPSNVLERGLKATSPLTWELALGTMGIRQGPITGLVGPTQPPVLATKVLNEAQKLFSPTTVSPEAGQAAGSIRASGGQAARDTATTAAQMEPFHRAVNAASEQERFDFIDHVEGGAGQPTQELSPLAGKLRDAYKLRRTKLEAMPATAQAQFIDEYYPHMWKDPNAARNVANAAGGAGKQGSGASLKKRSIPTYADGLRAKLEPVTTDPIEATMRYVESMDRFIAQQEVFNAAKDAGIIKYVRPKVMGASGHPDSFKIPQGYAPLEGRGARSVTGEQAYAPADWARVYNNYISQGFHGGQYGNVYDAMQSTSNSITALELGLSGYHAFTMANEAIISDVAKGISQLVGGKPIKALGSVARAPAAPITRYLSGKKGEQIYLGRTPGTPDLRKLVDLQTAAGGRAVGKGHAPDYRFSRMGSYWTAWKRGALKAQMAESMKNVQGSPLWSGPKELVKHIGRVMETVAQPIFETYIPRIKNGAFYDTMGAWIKENPAASYDQQVAMARKVWDSIDNRFGEMVQDNIFWDKHMKQVAQVAMRSYSWNMGTFREILGGVKGLIKDPSRLSIKHPDYDPRAAYVIALPVVVATTNAVYQYLKTGKGPESVDDLVAPRTGGTSPGFGGRGQVEERAMTPGYHRDVLGWYNDWKQEAANKVAKAPHMMFQALQPGGMKDFAGHPVVDPTAEGPAWLGQYFKWVADSISPISVKTALQGQKKGSTLGFGSSMMGIRPAPMWLQDPGGTKRGMAQIERRESRSKQKADIRRERQYGGPQE